jgi:integrase
MGSGDEFGFRRIEMGTLTRIFETNPTEVHPLGRTFGELPLEEVEEIFSQMDLTSNTRSQYVREIRRFVDWVSIEGWSSDVLIRFKNHLRGDVSIKTSSKNKYLTVSRVFCQRLNFLRVFPFEFEPPKSFKKSNGHKNRPLTKEDISNILELVQDDIVMNTLVHLLYFQGLRGNEIRTIEIEDVNLSNGTIQISGKGRDGDLEEVRLHPRTIEVLKTYVKETGLGSGFLFRGRSNDSPMSQSTFWRRLNGLFTSLGIESNPHSFRKSFVSGLIEGGMDLITVSNFSRHKTINQLQVYFDRVSMEKSFPQFVEYLEV